MRQLFLRLDLVSAHCPHRLKTALFVASRGLSARVAAFLNAARTLYWDTRMFARSYNKASPIDELMLNLSSQCCSSLTHIIQLGPHDRREGTLTWLNAIITNNTNTLRAVRIGIRLD